MPVRNLTPPTQVSTVAPYAPCAGCIPHRPICNEGTILKRIVSPYHPLSVVEVSDKIEASGIPTGTAGEVYFVTFPAVYFGGEQLPMSGQIWPMGNN